MQMHEPAMAAVELLETESRLARSLARKVSLMCAAQGVRGMLEQRSAVYLVVGKAIGDMHAAWVHGVWWDEEVAAVAAERLNAAAKAAGLAHGKPDLVGLEVDERRSVKQMLIGQDRLVEVGRHGVEWTVQHQQVR